MRAYILDDENRPVRVHHTDPRVHKLMNDVARRKVADTDVTDEICVSTVFLTLDHRYDDRGPPLLFETMVFNGPLDGHLWRYSSWDDAKIGHEAVVRKVREAVGQKVKS